MGGMNEMDGYVKIPLDAYEKLWERIVSLEKELRGAVGDLAAAEDRETSACTQVYEQRKRAERAEEELALLKKHLDQEAAR